MTVIVPPSQLALTRYRDLIKSLPYLEQAFETKRSTWQRVAYQKNTAFQSFLNEVFEEETVKISRSDVFGLASKDFTSTVFATILWGYPRNMRGSGFERILYAIVHLKKAFPTVKDLSKKQFLSIAHTLSGTGIGLSTLTKLLYFLGYYVEGKRCLILDRRIMDVINESLFVEFSALGKFNDYNKEVKYYQYLEKMQELAEAEGYKVDQLELFLFQFGNNLKYPVASLGKSGDL